MKKLKDYMEIQEKAGETTGVKIDANLVNLVKESLQKLSKKETITDKEIKNLIEKLLKEEIKIQNKMKKNRKKN